MLCYLTLGRGHNLSSRVMLGGMSCYQLPLFHFSLHGLSNVSHCNTTYSLCFESHSFTKPMIDLKRNEYIMNVMHVCTFKCLKIIDICCLEVYSYLILVVSRALRGNLKIVCKKETEWKVCTHKRINGSRHDCEGLLGYECWRLALH